MKKKVLASKYLNQEVVISDSESQEPWVGIIKSLFKEGGSMFYHVELLHGGGFIDVRVKSVLSIRPLSSIKLSELNSLNFAPLRIFSGLN